MTGIDVTALTIVEAAAAFRAGRFSPLQLTEAYLERIQRFDGELNSFITVTADEALRHPTWRIR